MWRAPGFKEFDDTHDGAAVGTQQPVGCDIRVVVIIIIVVGQRFDEQQRPGLSDVVATLCVGKEAVMTNAVKAARQDMDEEPAENSGVSSVIVLCRLSCLAR